MAIPTPPIVKGELWREHAEPRRIFTIGDQQDAGVWTAHAHDGTSVVVSEETLRKDYTYVDAWPPEHAADR